jgi:3-deoxy-manno-octulosonate cytidylyltransferase (CMP-KDO synthetase)
MNSERTLIYTGIIPARFASMRFPGKPLALIGNKPMIQLVYEQASKALANVFVATDDQRIFDSVAGFGGRVVMTSSLHQSGTDRCAEAAKIITGKTGIISDVIINIQGDEPFIKPEQIGLLIKCFTNDEVKLATLIRETGSGEDLFNPNQTKVVIDRNGYAIYFSRSVIPYVRGEEPANWTFRHSFYKHIGLYAYRTDVLGKLTMLDRTPLEIAESLEQNRWIENGFRIKTAITDWESIGIDTPDDLEKAKEAFGKDFHEIN